MSNRYNPDPSRDYGRSRDYTGRREDRYYDPADTRREEGDSPDYRHSASEERFREANRYPERAYGSERYPYVRGVYQEQAWSRDPKSGDVYGYDYSTRWPSSGAGSEAYHRPVRWRSAGVGNYGKGPKGYVRSDERIREDVCDRLSDDDDVDASEITVMVSNGVVQLEGSVVDRHSKHRAEDLAESVSGVRDVTNNLRARKGFFQEIGDKLSGDDKQEHRGHAGSGTQNAPTANSTRGQLSANR